LRGLLPDDTAIQASDDRHHGAGWRRVNGADVGVRPRLSRAADRGWQARLERDLTERYTRTGPDHLLYEVTIEDPKVFTRPWKISMPLYRRREKGVQILEYECVQFLEEQSIK
jgi:hypothetical protein